MKKLIINNHIINETIENILKDLRRRTHGIFLYDIKDPKNDYIMITCPVHSNHSEKHPSCGVYMGGDKEMEPGFFHCFTCGECGSLAKLVGLCLDMSEEEGKEWLLDNYGDTLVEEEFYLPEITFDKPKQQVVTPEMNYYNEAVLGKYNQVHPYTLSRGITTEVAQKYSIGYDRSTYCITFPMWDEYGRLVAINKRSVQGKKYILDGNRFKSVYLLNFALQEKAKTVYVCESQINALYLMSCFPQIHAVGLCGTGSQHQYDVLRKCGIKNYVLCLDGDDAGRKGTQRFIDNMPDDFLITVIKLPEGKDINDLSRQELIKLFDKEDIKLV